MVERHYGCLEKILIKKNITRFIHLYRTPFSYMMGLLLVIKYFTLLHMVGVTPNQGLILLVRTWCCFSWSSHQIEGWGYEYTGSSLLLEKPYKSTQGSHTISTIYLKSRNLDSITKETRINTPNDFCFFFIYMKQNNQ